jgi:hypothetical protein
MRLRRAVPPSSGRHVICFGGPLDGADCFNLIPDGYRDFGGVLIVWHAVKTSAMPMWRGHDFPEVVEHYLRDEREKG